MGLRTRIDADHRQLPVTASRHSRMRVRREAPDGQLLQPETVRLMTTNRLTTEQRRMPFMGALLSASRGLWTGHLDGDGRATTASSAGRAVSG